MKHVTVTAACAPDCACMPCCHRRTIAHAPARRERATTIICCAAGVAGLILIPGRLAFHLAAHALGF